MPAIVGCAASLSQLQELQNVEWRLGSRGSHLQQMSFVFQFIFKLFQCVISFFDHMESKLYIGLNTEGFLVVFKILLLMVGLEIN